MFQMAKIPSFSHASEVSNFGQRISCLSNSFYLCKKKEYDLKKFLEFPNQN